MDFNLTHGAATDPRRNKKSLRDFPDAYWRESTTKNIPKFLSSFSELGWLAALIPEE